MAASAANSAMCVQSEAGYWPLMADVVQSLAPLVKQSLVPLEEAVLELPSGTLSKGLGSNQVSKAN